MDLSILDYIYMPIFQMMFLRIFIIELGKPHGVNGDELCQDKSFVTYQGSTTAPISAGWCAKIRGTDDSLYTLW